MGKRIVITLDNFDREKVTRAVELLLDPVRGPGRVRLVRRFLSGELKPTEITARTHAAMPDVGYFIRFGLQNGRTALRILELVEEHRPSEEALSDSTKKYLRDRMREVRNREALAVQVEEIRRGRKMPASEREEFLVGVRQRWRIRRNKFVEENPQLRPREALRVFKTNLTAELAAKLQQAKEAGPIKQTSTSSAYRQKQPARSNSSLRTQLQQALKKS